jgi:hypothetical protein
MLSGLELFEALSLRMAKIVMDGNSGSENTKFLSLTT